MKRKTASPRVVARKSATKPLVISSALVPSPVRQYGHDTIKFPPRTEAFSEAELAGLDIPAFLRRALPSHTEVIQ